MRHVLAAAAVGAGIALIAFVVDWLLDHLDEVDEPEPLWPPGKPYSRTTIQYGNSDALPPYRDWWNSSAVNVG